MNRISDPALFIKHRKWIEVAEPRFCHLPPFAVR